MRTPKSADELLPEPYLHIKSDRIYNPITDMEMRPDAPLNDALRHWVDLQRCPASLDHQARKDLLANGWLIARTLNQDNRFRLMYVSLETHTLCNQKCYFCPVSVAPRNSYFMPRPLFDKILEQLTEYRSTIRGIFLHNYNEPTLNPDFVLEVKSVLAQ